MNGGDRHLTSRPRPVVAAGDDQPDRGQEHEIALGSTTARCGIGDARAKSRRGSFAARAPMIGNASWTEGEMAPSSAIQEQRPPARDHRGPLSVPYQTVRGTVRSTRRRLLGKHLQHVALEVDDLVFGGQAVASSLEACSVRPAPRARLRRHARDGEADLRRDRGRDGDLRDAVDRSLLVQRAIRDLLDGGRLDDEVGEDARIDLLDGGDEARALLGRPRPAGRCPTRLASWRIPALASGVVIAPRPSAAACRAWSAFWRARSRKLIGHQSTGPVNGSRGR